MGTGSPAALRKRSCSNLGTLPPRRILPRCSARSVADVIENPDAPFRVAVGNSVQPLIEAHDSTPYGELVDIVAAARAGG